MENRTERRLTRRLIHYWESLKKSEGMPRIEDFDSAIIGDAWAKCARITADKNGYAFDYMGVDVSAIYGCDLTGQPAEAVSKGFPGAIVCRNVEKAVRDRHFAEDNGYFFTGTSSSGGIKYRACVLPFGDKEKVTHLVVGLSYKLSAV